ncbi:MAG: response regulator transcription factor [Actinomycetota bacterium]
MSDDPISLVIVDDHRVVREGLRAMLDGIEEVRIVGEAEDGAGAFAEIEREQPQVVLLDLRLQKESGLDICRAIGERFPDVHVVFLTVYEDEQYVFEALRAGARGYMLKKASPEDLVRILGSVQAGEVVIDPSLGGQIALRAASMRTGDSWPGVHEGLTRREGDVLEQLVKGLNNREIAGALFISEDTVKTHVRGVLRKLGVKDRAQAVSYALRNGLAT